MPPADGAEPLTIRVAEVVGEEGVESADGKRLYDRLHPVLLAGGEVELDFRGVEVLSEPFFEAAVGELLRDIPFEDLLSRLIVNNITVRDLQGLRYVLEHGCDMEGRAEEDGPEKP